MTFVYAFFSGRCKKCCMVLPMLSRLMHYSGMCIKQRPTASTLSPSVSLQKGAGVKLHLRSNKAQKVDGSNAMLSMLWC